MNTGSIGEWIAARIFDIELETAANVAGYDGHFTTFYGPEKAFFDKTWRLADVERVH